MGEVTLNEQIQIEVLPPLTLHLEFVDPTRLDLIWPALEIGLDSSRQVWEPYHTMESIYKSLLEGNMQAWMVRDEDHIHYMFLTVCASYEIRKIVRVIWAAGAISKQIIALCDEGLEKFAQMVHADTIEIIGRFGWVRVFKDLGFEFESVTLSRTVGRDGSLQ